MDVRDILTNTIRSIVTSVDRPITASLGEVLVVAALALAAFSVLAGILLTLKSRKLKSLPDPTVQLVSGIRGKLEKLEQALNQLKTERARAKEFYRVELDSIRGEINELKVQMFGAGAKKSATAQHPVEEYADVAGESEAAPDIDFSEIDRVSQKFTAPVTESVPLTLVDAQVIQDEIAVTSQINTVDTVETKKARDTLTSFSLDGLSTDQPAEVKEETSIKGGLLKARTGFFQKLKDLFAGKPAIDESTLEELEALLVGSDLGIGTAQALIAEVKSEVQNKGALSEEDLTALLAEKIKNILETDTPEELQIVPSRRADGALIVLVVGVNGVGKTTTVAKLASQWKDAGKRVLLVAADTFRAAAVDQLAEWGMRLDVPVVSGADEAKPASVVFDGMKRAQEEEFDVVIIDTAGRLHNKANLMQELEGVKNSIARHQPTAPHETILVVDGTSGQNALQQAKEFNEAVPLTGVIVTKLDGSPKGGVVVAIKQEIGVPVRYIGVGEAPKDLKAFVARDFAEALFSKTVVNGGSNEASAHAEERKRKRRDTTWSI